MRLQKIAVGLAATLVALALAGCDLEQLAVTQTSGVLKHGAPALAEENDLQFAREAAPASLKTVEAFLIVQPANQTLLELTAQGYCEYTFGFLEGDLEKMSDQESPAAKTLNIRATNFYMRCMNYGLKLLAQTDSSHWPEWISKDLPTLDKHLKGLGKGDVPGLFYTGLGLASAINLNRDNYDLLTYIPKVEHIMLRVLALDPNFYNGGAHLALGSLYATQGASVGGKPAEALKHFQAAIAMTKGRFLLHKVMLAHVYAVTTNNRALFEKTLMEVLRAPGGIWPEFRLANEIAKDRARWYWTHRNDVFE